MKEEREREREGGREERNREEEGWRREGEREEERKRDKCVFTLLHIAQALGF